MQAGNESTAQSLNGGVHSALGTEIVSEILRVRIMLRSSRQREQQINKAHTGSVTEYGWCLVWIA